MDGHNKLRKRLCIICGAHSKVNISPATSETISEYLIEGFSLSDTRFGGGLCKSCYNTINEYGKGNFTRLLPEWFDYWSISGYKIPRSGECKCPLCVRAKSAYLFGHKSTKVRSKGRPTYVSKEEVRIIQLCSKCLLPVEAELKNHECRQKNALEAIQLLKSTASPRSLKRFACEIIKEHWNVDEEVELNTGGRPLKVRKVGSDGDGEPSKKIAHETLDKIRVSANISVNQTLAIAKELRGALGSSAIEPNFPEHIRMSNKRFNDFFKVASYDGKPFVYCSDLHGFLRAVEEHRNISDVAYRVGTDMGREIMKTTLSVLDLSHTSSSSDGLKLSGVKRCFIIAAMLNTKETYDSVKHQLEHSGVKDLFASSDKVTLSCDLKMLNIIFGLGSHTSSNPCVLCDWQRYQLGSRRSTSTNIRRHCKKL